MRLPACRRLLFPLFFWLQSRKKLGSNTNRNFPRLLLAAPRQPFLASHAILTNECGTGTRDQRLLATQATEMSESEGFNLNPYGEPPLIS